MIYKRNDVCQDFQHTVRGCIPLKTAPMGRCSTTLSSAFWGSLTDRTFIIWYVKARADYLRSSILIKEIEFIVYPSYRKSVFVLSYNARCLALMEVFFFSLDSFLSVVANFLNVVRKRSLYKLWDLQIVFLDIYDGVEFPSLNHAKIFESIPDDRTTVNK